MTFNRELLYRAFERRQASTHERPNSAAAQAVRRVAIALLGGGERRRIEILDGEARRAWLQHCGERNRVGQSAAIAGVAATPRAASCH